jgi:hypothetical protein
VIIVLLAAAVFGVAAGVLLWANAPSVTARTPVATTRHAEPMIVVRVAHASMLSRSEAHVTVDGESVSDIDVHDDTIEAHPSTLSEGDHKVHVWTDNFGIMQRSIDQRWTISVDTTAPKLRVLPAAARSSASSTPMQVVTEPEAMVTFVAGDKSTEGTADEHGKLRAHVAISDGRQTVHISARDAAGNVTEATRIIEVDSRKPSLSVPLPKRLTKRAVSLRLGVTDAHPVTPTATIDGDVDGVSLKKAGRVSWLLTADTPFAEGTHRVAITAKDSFGNVTTVTRTTLVDSTETLGVNNMRRGAQGNDVRQLHTLLAKLKFFRKGEQKAGAEWRTKRYGAATAAAVCAFQRDKGLEDDCIVGDETLAAMTLRIVVDRSANTLTLYKNGKVEKVYHVATGQPAYPTPSGEFEITDMQEDPTWTPPDSEWAKDAKPIAPGPDNPLGTRWMGLSAPSVGIHGTNNPASIGYSVSHGCIRMAIPDVEDLFQRVRIGTPVIIR